MPDLKSIYGMKYTVLSESQLEIIEIQNQFCSAVISLQGAQILKFQSKTNQTKEDLLWLSELNQYKPGKAIRGGIPLCFPWFGGHKIDSTYPAHGFARYLPWQLIDAIYSESTGHELVFQLKDTAHTRSLWNHSFQIQIKIRCQKNLTLHFEVVNTGDASFEYEFAWHSYFPADIASAKIKGLRHTEYIDQLQDMQCFTQAEEYIEIKQEIDRIYLKTQGVFEISSLQKPLIYVESDASGAVVWNPWIDKTQRLADVDDDAWQKFLCLECGQLKGASVKLAPHQSKIYKLMISH